MDSLKHNNVSSFVSEDAYLNPKETGVTTKKTSISSKLLKLIINKSLKKYNLEIINIIDSNNLEIKHETFSIGISNTFLVSVFKVIFSSNPDMIVGEGYMEKKWWVRQGTLEAVIDILYGINQDLSQSNLFQGIKKRQFYNTQLNTTKTSKENIASHYDHWNKNNDFFVAKLGSSMSYSSALYDLSNNNENLSEAQVRKIQSITNLMAIKENQSVLDIGCGWGSLSHHIASLGAKVTALTLSEEQHKWCLEQDQYLNEKYLLEDYRDHCKKHSNEYDHVTCLEVLDHIGQPQFDSFFDSVNQMLKPNGCFTMQLILRPEKGITTKWIDKYIYPGGYIASYEEVEKAFTKANFELDTIHNYTGEHYARTLEAWREGMLLNWDNLAKKYNYTDVDLRMWLFYYASSISVFRSAGFSTTQLKLKTTK